MRGGRGGEGGGVGGGQVEHAAELEGDEEEATAKGFLVKLWRPAGLPFTHIKPMLLKPSTGAASYTAG